MLARSQLAAILSLILCLYEFIFVVEFEIRAHSRIGYDLSVIVLVKGIANGADVIAQLLVKVIVLAILARGLIFLFIFLNHIHSLLKSFEIFLYIGFGNLEQHGASVRAVFDVGNCQNPLNEPLLVTDIVGSACLHRRFTGCLIQGFFKIRSSHRVYASR